MVAWKVVGRRRLMVRSGEAAKSRNLHTWRSRFAGTRVLARIYLPIKTDLRPAQLVAN